MRSASRARPRRDGGRCGRRLPHPGERAQELTADIIGGALPVVAPADHVTFGRDLPPANPAGHIDLGVVPGWVPMRRCWSI